jgi:hypothetical protein
MTATSSPAPKVTAQATASRDILEHFTGDPRPEQVEVLRELQRRWNTADVFIVRAPVGAGKSRIAHCLGAWAGGATVNTPTNMLVTQYLDTWPALGHVHRAASYRSASEYRGALASARAAPLTVCNYFSYLAHRLYSRCVVFDEAHRLIPMLQEMEEIKLWESQYPMPGWVRTSGDLLAWAVANAGKDKRLKKLANKLTQHPDTYMIERLEGELRNKAQEYTRLVPLTPRHNKPILWPPRTVKKLVFMSATFHEEDLYDLGLEGRRVAVIECESPIPATDRPVVYDPVGSLSHDNQAATLPALVAKLNELLAKHDSERGVIHATYDLARTLRTTELANHPRLVWHGQSNRDRVYRDWLNNGQPDSVLVACGMSEGIDLAGDLARWQVVTKMMYPNKSDPAVAAKLALRPAWYNWVAARDVQQTVGRSSRGPGDFSVNYIVDSAFGSLYSNNREMFSPSFREALHVCT